MGVMRVNWAQWSDTFPALRRSRRFAQLIDFDQKGSITSSLREMLISANPEEQRHIVIDFLVRQVSRVMQFVEYEFGLHTSVVELGMDSIMAMELSSIIVEEIGVTIPVMVFLGGPSITDLAEYILKKIQEAQQTSAPPASSSGHKIDTTEETTELLAAKIEKLSDTEVDLLLNRLLAEGGEQE